MRSINGRASSHNLQTSLGTERTDDLSEKKINGVTTGRTVLKMIWPKFSSLAFSPLTPHHTDTTESEKRVPITITHQRLVSLMMSSSKHNGNIPNAHQQELLS